MITDNPPDDILAAIAAYLQESMGLSLAAPATAAFPNGYPQAYSEYAPSTNPDGSALTPPFAVVNEGDESYAAQSEDPATGHFLSNIANGTAFIHFLAPSKAQARALCRRAVRLMSDTVVQLAAQDGRVITLLPLRSQRMPQPSAGVGDEPAIFERVLTVQYLQQFTE
jgi:hypothetical protein